MRKPILNAADAPSAGSGGAGASTEALLDFFIKREQVYNDFVRALGQYKLNVAQAELAEAQAAGQIERAMILDTVRMQLYSDLQRLDAESQVAERRIHDLQVKARYALKLLEGRTVAGSFGSVRDCYKYFETRAMIEADEALFKPLSASGEGVTGADFLDNHSPDRPCLDPKAADLRNVLTLINWTFPMQYLARPGTPAMFLFVQLFRAIGSVAGETVGQLNQYIDQIRKNTYDTWKPVMLAGLDASAAAKAILESTGGNKMA